MCTENKQCKAKNCQKRELREGFCKVHLIQFLNGEEIEIGTNECIIEDCNLEAVTAVGYCHTHKNQAYRWGRAYSEKELKEVKPHLFCKESGCINRRKTGGYCEEHKHLVKDDKLKCSEPKCKHKVFKDGICRQHYIEKLDFSQLKGVVTPFDKETVRNDDWCRIKNCKNDAKYEGYCFLHGRLILDGELDEYMTDNGSKLCTVSDCDEIVKGKGLCHRHYQQFNKYGKAFTNEEHKKIVPQYYLYLKTCCSEKRELDSVLRGTCSKT
ncbi:Cysteine-rich protein [Bacillus thuringiensis serovar israelensis ATCC 35646]|nr:Cysteine-rich protein [Bacillus thuringiensis serovar israelensis ATCC 35646]